MLFFLPRVQGSGLNNDKGKYVLNSWNNANHQIGNHTYSHPYFNAENYSLKQFENELLKNDSLINSYSNYAKLFRFPYLKEGNTVEKRDGFRTFMKSKGFKNGHVTIDASDWYVNSRLIKRLKKNPDADISGFKKYDIEHLYGRALYYDSLAEN
jgi:peptidoglycan/xylan/chitin deacetylase (PgdA/CDA1 family)